MPAVAKKGGSSQVRATDGAKGPSCASGKWHWSVATTQASDAGSDDVFIENIGAVRQGDIMKSHPDGVPCTSSPINHAPALSTYSSNVFVNGKAIGRIGDVYDSDGHYDHAITTGASTVFANGAGPGLVNTGGASTYNGSVTVAGPGGGPQTGTTTREPLNPKPGEKYNVTVSGIPDGPVTYTDPNTGQVVTAIAEHGRISLDFVAPTAVTGSDKFQAVDFTFSDGSTNGGSLVVIPDAMITATQNYIDTHPGWRDDFRDAYFKAIHADPNDGVIVTNPGDWSPGQFWYDFIYQNTPDLPPPA